MEARFSQINLCSNPVTNIKSGRSMFSASFAVQVIATSYVEWIINCALPNVKF